MRTSLIVIPTLFLAACTAGDDGGGDPATEVAGAAVYRDATTDHDGNARAPAAPPAQEARVTIILDGGVELPDLDPACGLELSGNFGDGAFVASVLAGCELPTLPPEVGTVTVRAELEATTQNCQTYCAASARADAEAECGASPSDAACRAEAEVAAETACSTTCTSQAEAIVAEATLDATELGEVHADLVFDHAE